MTIKKEVNEFLRDFKIKMKIWDVVFRDDRQLNIQTLLDLELRPIERKKILENLETIDFCEGPQKDQQCGGRDMWIFGKDVKKKEVYIKITMGRKNTSVICISFHIAKHPMTYPLK